MMAFDVYMIIAITIFFENCGGIILHKSQKWYGPTTQHYQVTSGTSLTAGTNINSLLSGKKSIKDDSETLNSAVPPAPLAHLTAQNIVYEVDVDVTPEEEKRLDNDKAEPKPDGENEATKAGS